MSAEQLSDTERLHFTYVAPQASESLEQGDILEKNDEIKDLISKVHPHYLKEDYTHFILLTQSCDIVRSRNRLKARYLTLAAVRPLSLVLAREVEKEQKHALEKGANCVSSAKRGNFQDFIYKLLNNNNSDYFYLHSEPSFGFSEPSCAFLRLSVAVRADEHYDKCLKARKFSLENTFKAKLGWLVGDMYSRVGTPDWVPDYTTRQEFSKLVGDLLDGACQWVDANKLDRAKKLYQAENGSQSKDQLRAFIENTEPLSKRDKAIERVVEILGEYEGLANDELRNNISIRLKNDATLNTLIK